MIRHHKFSDFLPKGIHWGSSPQREQRERKAHKKKTMDIKKSYEYHNGILSIPASLLYEDWGVMTESAYYKNCQRGKLVVTRRACKNNEALVSYYDLPESIKALCMEKLGHPDDVVVLTFLED